MEKALVACVAIITIPTCLFLTWYFWHSAKHKERLLLLEKGLDPSESVDKVQKVSLLKLGIVVIGLSTGLFLINISEAAFGSISDAACLSLMGLSGGVSLILANRAGNVNGK